MKHSFFLNITDHSRTQFMIYSFLWEAFDKLPKTIPTGIINKGQKKYKKFQFIKRQKDAKIQTWNLLKQFKH